MWEWGDGGKMNSYQLLRKTTKHRIYIWINQYSSLKFFYENWD